MHKPIVIFDLDNVLADWNFAFINYSRRVLGKPRKGQEPVITDFHLEKIGYWNKHEVDRVINFTKGERNFWEGLARMAGTSRLVKDYSNLNCFFVTARYTTDGHPTESQSAEWLYRNFGIRDAYVIVDADKGKVAADIGAEWAIDDRDTNCVEIVEAAPSCKSYVLDQPWNRNLTDPRVKRVKTVNEFIGDILDGR